MRSSIIGLAIIFGFGVIGVIEAARADGLSGYVLTNTTNSVVFRTDFETGEQTPLGPSVRELDSLAISSTDGSLFATGADLFQIDLTTGVARSVTFSWGGNDLAYSDEMLFGFSGNSSHDRFLSYNLRTGESVDFGRPDSVVQVGAFTIDAAGNGILWEQGSQFLISVDISDASTSVLGWLPGDFDDFSYGPNGVLYGWSGDENTNGTLYRIDVDRLESTVVRQFDVGGSAFVLDPASVPEPSTIVSMLILSATTIMYSRRIRRCKVSLC